MSKEYNGIHKYSVLVLFALQFIAHVSEQELDKYCDLSRIYGHIP